MDVQALKSVENIRKMIAQYREEQERLFTKISPETNKLPPLNFREQSLERLFDHCCLLSISQNSGQMLGTWPIALIGSYSTKGVSLGSFDNHGSLWRFIRVDENHQSIRVVIECSEIGEKPLFLTSNLDLTENNSYAAEWIVSQPNSPSKNPSTSTDLRVHIRAADDRRFLCCQEQAGVALLPEEELSQSGDSSGYWSSEWTIISEDAPLFGNDEFKFLDDAEGFLE